MNCQYCGCELVKSEEGEATCYKCQQEPSNRVMKQNTRTSREEVSENIAHGDPVRAEIPTSGNSGSSYQTARAIATFTSFMGWVIFASGPFILLAGLIIGSQSRLGGGFSIAALFPAIGVSVSGLILVMSGQVTRAVVDTADRATDILGIMQERT